jgi:pectate lyase
VEKGGSLHMPLVRLVRVYIYNNYNSSAGKKYCNKARIGAEILLGYNYFGKVRNPLSAEQDGKAQNRGNEYVNTIGTIHSGTDEEFVPS